MRKLFGHAKAKTTRPSVIPKESEDPIPTPIHQQHAAFPNVQQLPAQAPNSNFRSASIDEEHWEMVSGYDEGHVRNRHPSSSPSRTPSLASLPPGASPPMPSPNVPRSPSPYSIATNSSSATTKLSHVRDRDGQYSTQQAVSRKRQPPNASAALGILRALEPPRSDLQPSRLYSEEQVPSYQDSGHKERELGEKKERRGFWSRDRDKDKDKAAEREKERGRERERKEDNQADLSGMIGYLTATASEDWALVLEVCERASASEANAKDAVRALRREFKYGPPSAQLSAARLWAIMLRNSSGVFISQSTTRKFLDTLEDLLVSSRTSPVVKDRILDVIAAAAYASGSEKDGGFRGLWRRVKPPGKPDGGMPFDNNDAIFNPPISGRLSQHDTPVATYQEPSLLLVEPPPPLASDAPRKRKSPTRNRIIPPDEDIRRLLQECKIGQGNASLLSQALALSKPEDLKTKDVIEEFYLKSCASQELIFAQIPWASAGAERSRAQENQEILARTGRLPDSTDPPVEPTIEEQLLEALLGANAELMDALTLYKDMEQVAMEREAEERSRRETHMDRVHSHHIDPEGNYSSNSLSGRSSRSLSPSRPPSPHLVPQQYLFNGGPDSSSLAPPPAAPLGPRSPMHNPAHPRTPSPGMSRTSEAAVHVRQSSSGSSDSLSDENGYVPAQPSAKALGKRREINVGPPESSYDDAHYDNKERRYSSPHLDSDDESDLDGWQQQQPVHYVYDAVAERTQQRLREGQHALLINGVH